MSNLYLSGSEFLQNYASEGGVIYSDNQGFSYISNIKAYKNYALATGGVIQGLTASNFELVNSKLYENYADQGSCIYVNNPAKDKQIRIEGTTFLNNLAGENTLQIIYAYNFTIKRSEFIKNDASRVSKNIFIGFSNVSIETSNF